MKRAEMDLETTVARPLTAVFSHLAEPARLGDWLPGITGPPAGAATPARTGAGFSLRLATGAGELAGTGELIAYEPPWSVAYRLRAGPHTHILRLTCTARGPAATRVRIHQAGTGPPLTADLTRLHQATAPAASHPRTPAQHPGGTSHPAATTQRKKTPP
jgi:uncharacterized protein YndB with AHSA1/START domain